MQKDRILRFLIPSVPLLARTRLAPLLDFADRLYKKFHPEFWDLPPASLRMRIGVGNRIFRNHRYFVNSANELISDLANKGYLRQDSQILEIGCGCGRVAAGLKRFLGEKGAYTGQDVDREMIEWCQVNLSSDRMKFYHANIYSSVYNPNGISISSYSLPAPASSVTLVLCASVFSHLLPTETSHYINEISRVLSSGGFLVMGVFLIDFIRPHLGGRWTFRHKLDKCYVESLKYPEAAVAYELATIRKILSKHALEIVDIKDTEKPTQQTVIARCFV